MSTAENPAGSHDRPNASQADVALAEPFTGCKTIGEMFRRAKLESLERVRKLLPPDIHEQISRQMLRYFEPWPDWVLRVAAEVLRVSFPTIPKDDVLAALRWLNFFVFEARIDKLPLDNRPNLSPRLLGAIVGHLLAFNLECQRLFSETREAIPADKFAEYERGASLKEFELRIVPLMANYIKIKPSAFLEFQDALTDAKTKTFDKYGSCKETPLTPIYRKILSDWPEIEGLSGPKAMTEYLSSMLGNQDFEDKYERVKAICKRMRIKFRPFVKGRRSVSSASLHGLPPV